MIVTYLFIAVVMIGFLVHVGHSEMAMLIIGALAVAGYTIESLKTVMKIEVWAKGVFLDGAKVKTEYHVNGK